MTIKTTHASAYANKLLEMLGCPAQPGKPMDHPALAWRRAGFCAVQGEIPTAGAGVTTEAQTGAMAPVPIASAADGALLALKALSPEPDSLPSHGAGLLGERARMLGYACRENLNASGSARLLDTKDGRIALNMARETDWDLMPALFEQPVDDWAGVARALKTRDSEEIVARGALLGLAIANDALPPLREDWYQLSHSAGSNHAGPGAGARPDAPLAVDLSALWAGPLASSLLQKCGARVIKAESPTRPDGMRAGHQGFYSLLNAEKECLSLRFDTDDGIADLLALLDKADIVIEASRPRALRQLGVRAEDLIARQRGKIWVRLTAYGQDCERVGFGDDIAISAGAAQLMRRAHGSPQFMGDALADPISGLHAAVAVMALRARGVGGILDINMQRVVRHAFGAVPAGPERVHKKCDRFLGSDARHPKDPDRLHDQGFCECGPDGITEIAEAWSALARSDTAPLYPLRRPNRQQANRQSRLAGWQA